MQFSEVKDFMLDKLERELPEQLFYHSVGHIRDVYDSAAYIGEKEGIGDEEMKLLLTAVLFHDAGFLKGSKEHEATSCDVARELLPGYGYTDEQIDKICGMIMATRIPQTPNNLLEEIICDADLDYLGRDDFYTIGNTLYKELLVSGAINNEKEWNELQVKFLQGHHYFTNTAQQLRKKPKQARLEEIIAKLSKDND